MPRRENNRERAVKWTEWAVFREHVCLEFLLPVLPPPPLSVGIYTYIFFTCMHTHTHSNIYLFTLTRLRVMHSVTRQDGWFRMCICICSPRIYAFHVRISFSSCLPENKLIFAVAFHTVSPNQSMYTRKPFIERGRQKLINIANACRQTRPVRDWFDTLE